MKAIFICTISYLIFQCQGRKYDIEQESQKLYDGSFTAVVQRFRSTPEYLKILKEQVLVLGNDVQQMMDRIFFTYKTDLEEAVVKEISENVSMNVLRGRKQIFRVIPTKLSTSRTINKNKLRNKKNLRDKQREQLYVDMLDGYDKFHSNLTLEERNKVRDMAFEYNGKAVHELIERWQPDGSDSKMSTKLPAGGDQPEKTTKEHVHKVTKPNGASKHDHHEHIGHEPTDLTIVDRHLLYSTAMLDSQRNF